MCNSRTLKNPRVFEQLLNATGGNLDVLEELIHLMSAMPESYSQVVTALETLDEDQLTVERILECGLKIHGGTRNSSNKFENLYLDDKSSHSFNNIEPLQNRILD